MVCKHGSDEEMQFPECVPPSVTRPPLGQKTIEAWSVPFWLWGQMVGDAPAGRVFE